MMRLRTVTTLRPGVTPSFCTEKERARPCPPWDVLDHVRKNRGAQTRGSGSLRDYPGCRFPKPGSGETGGDSYLGSTAQPFMSPVLLAWVQLAKDDPGIGPGIEIRVSWAEHLGSYRAVSFSSAGPARSLMRGGRGSDRDPSPGVQHDPHLSSEFCLYIWGRQDRSWSL
ncbi:hypothetical protein ARTHRO9AX_220222 [Arthrobacter sp. 9AX]|nr:hypothetical protein ARTHRO9AX_220222 [Arthrobacter sp. 9AX]